MPAKSKHNLREYIRIRVPKSDADYYREVYGKDAEDMMRDRIHAWVEIRKRITCVG